MYSAIAENKRRTVLIMTFFVVIIGLLGWLYARIWGGGRPSITIGVLIGSAIYALLSYFAGSKMALASSGAQEVSRQENPRLYRIVENMAITDGLPMPKVYVMSDPALNAFATGRNPQNASVCVTAGLLEALTDSELQGVIAHEMGHIKNYDMRVNVVAFGLTAAIGLLADMMLRLSWFSGGDDNDKNGQAFMFLGIIAGVLAPLIASLVQLAVSRQREYLADATGALTTRHPEGLIKALEKIGAYGSTLQKQSTSTAHFFIANPLKKHSLASLFSTHPPIEQRIERLRKIGHKA